MRLITGKYGIVYSVTLYFLYGSLFLGIVGLNNIKANDYMNIVLHALAHVLPFTSYFLSEDNYKHITPPPGDQTFILGTCMVFFLSVHVSIILSIST